MDKFLLFGFINYMVGNNFIIGFVSGLFVGVNYHTSLSPYTKSIEHEVKKKFDEYKDVYDENDKKNNDKKSWKFW